MPGVGGGALRAGVMYTNYTWTSKCLGLFFFFSPDASLSSLSFRLSPPLFRSQSAPARRSFGSLAVKQRAAGQTEKAGSTSSPPPSPTHYRFDGVTRYCRNDCDI